MFNKFKKGSKVFIYGPGKNDGTFYFNKAAVILERDPYFKDYHVRFKNGTEDWISSQYIRKPYSRKKGI